MRCRRITDGSTKTVDTCGVEPLDEPWRRPGEVSPLALVLVEASQTIGDITVKQMDWRLELPARKYWPQPRSTGLRNRMQSAMLLVNT